ncbi:MULTISPECIES: response regulator transcription factor [unclassified Nocardioides]|uniref:response regulator transcription factor n=1 Tax=unclassified Nocardioides TaxID=2615069 RepID=UPI0012E3349F|nr:MULTISPECIES: response regulator transcription factor [unclassified Nocardioides]
MSAVIRVGAIDNHPVVLAGVGAALAKHAPDMALVSIAGSVDELLENTPDGLDVVLLDLHIPDQPVAEESVAALVARDIVVLLFTAEERPMPVRRAIQAGAAGLVLKVDPIQTIAQAIRDGVAGELACSGQLAAMLLTDDGLGTRLSQRQIEILRAVSTGLPYRLVARDLGISEVTVREHLFRAARAYRSGGVDPGNVHGLISRARADGHLDE